MSNNVRTILILVVVVSLIFAWMMRYDVTASPNMAGMFVTDRWTGTVYLCGLGECSQQFPAN